MEWAVILESIAVAIAAISVMSSVSAWKREFVGKRRMELAESILACLYEAEDAIRAIRNPLSSSEEGSTRKRKEGEREEEARLLDRAYIVCERYEKKEELFAKLRSLKYHAKAVFGSRAAEPFDEIDKVLKEIFIAAYMLGSHLWPRQGHDPMEREEFQKHLKDMQKHEAVFWFTGEKEDEIGPRVHRAVEKFEEVAASTADFTTGPISRVKRWVRG